MKVAALFRPLAENITRVLAEKCTTNGFKDQANQANKNVNNHNVCIFV